MEAMAWFVIGATLLFLFVTITIAYKSDKRNKI